MMTPYREELGNRMIRLYGFEHEAVVEFFRLCEVLLDNEWNKNLLTILVEAHEDDPLFEEI